MTPADFIGYNIAPWDFDWSNTGLRNLVSALAPMAVRCGGTWEDGIFWEAGPQSGHWPGIPKDMAAHNLTEEKWTPFVELMNQVEGIDLVVGLGALWRHWGSCNVDPASVCPTPIPWDSSNAESFIKHNHNKGYRIYGYELGNEPAVWNYTWKTPIVTPQQHAADFAALKAVLNKEYSATSADVPNVVGPDTTWGPVGDELPDGGRNPIPGKGRPNYNYWNATLQAGAAVDVAAFHYYGIQPGLVTSWETFVKTAADGSVCTATAAHFRDLESSPLAGKVPLWLGEGGASYGGFGHDDVKGDNWLRLFGGALSYLENLGCAATNGAQVFARQQLTNFIGGKNGALASKFTPMPAWWVAVLWKRLVGTKAYGTVTTGSDSIHARGFDAKDGSTGSSVVAVVNWGTPKQAIVLHGCKKRVQVYALTPAGPIDSGGDDNGTPLVDSTGIAVNGKEALTDEDGKVIPGTLDPSTVACSAGRAQLEVEGLTAAFVVLE